MTYILSTKLMIVVIQVLYITQFFINSSLVILHLFVNASQVELLVHSNSFLFLINILQQMFLFIISSMFKSILMLAIMPSNINGVNCLQTSDLSVKVKTSHISEIIIFSYKKISAFMTFCTPCMINCQNSKPSLDSRRCTIVSFPVYYLSRVASEPFRHFAANENLLCHAFTSDY